MYTKERNSSIELLKIIGILLIVLSHVVQTLGNSMLPFEGYCIDLTAPTTNIQYLIIAMMQYSGIFGNTIFFVCSAWFLLDSKTVNKKKILLMISDIWVVSCLILIIVLIIRKGNLNGGLIITSLLPNTFGNNWYLSCYMIFYAIHPALNKIINELSQKALLRTAFIMAFLYLGISFFTILTGHLFSAENSFFSSKLIVWGTIYFIIGYQKLYLKSFSENEKINIRFVVLGLIGTYGLILFTNYFEIETGIFNHAVLLWNVAYNPFLILLVIGLFNLVKKKYYVNKPINYISKLSLYIYIIHENLLLRTLYRPAMWNYVYTHFGYNYILCWVVLFVLVVFMFGLLSSIVYINSIHRLTIKSCNLFYPKLLSAWDYIENKLLKLH